METQNNNKIMTDIAKKIYLQVCFLKIEHHHSQADQYNSQVRQEQTQGQQSVSLHHWKKMLRRLFELPFEHLYEAKK